MTRAGQHGTGRSGRSPALATAAGVVQRRLALPTPLSPRDRRPAPPPRPGAPRVGSPAVLPRPSTRTTAVAELGTVGEALRTHADELSTTHASLRAVLDRAAARGLVLEDRHLRPEPGIRGRSTQHEVDLDDELSLLEAQLQSLIRDAARDELARGRARGSMTSCGGGVRPTAARVRGSRPWTSAPAPTTTTGPTRSSPS